MRSDADSYKLGTSVGASVGPGGGHYSETPGTAICWRYAWLCRPIRLCQGPCLPALWPFASEQLVCLFLFRPPNPFSSRVSSHQTSNTVPVLKILFYPSEGLSGPLDAYEHHLSNAATCFNPRSPVVVINTKNSAKINICAVFAQGHFLSTTQAG